MKPVAKLVRASRCCALKMILKLMASLKYSSSAPHCLPMLNGVRRHPMKPMTTLHPLLQFMHMLLMMKMMLPHQFLLHCVKIQRQALLLRPSTTSTRLHQDLHHLPKKFRRSVSSTLFGHLMTWGRSIRVDSLQAGILDWVVYVLLSLQLPFCSFDVLGCKLKSWWTSATFATLVALLKFDLMRVKSFCRFPYVIVHFIIFKLSAMHYDWIPWYRGSSPQSKPIMCICLQSKIFICTSSGGVLSISWNHNLHVLTFAYLYPRWKLQLDCHQSPKRGRL